MLVVALAAAESFFVGDAL